MPREKRGCGLGTSLQFRIPENFPREIKPGLEIDQCLQMPGGLGQEFSTVSHPAEKPLLGRE